MINEIKSKLKNVIRFFLKVKPKNNRTGYLIFHSLSEKNPNGLSGEYFSGLIEYLLGKGVKFKKYNDISKNREGINVILTFDDGYESVYHNAKQTCSENGISPILFICPGLIGKSREIIESRKIPLKDDNLMSWDMINELVKKGWDLGSHTNDHLVLSSKCLPEICINLTESKKLIYYHTGVNVDALCFPIGRLNHFLNFDLKSFRECGFKFGFIGLHGTISNQSKLEDLWIPRVHVSESDSYEHVYLQLRGMSSRMFLFDILKDILMSPRIIFYNGSAFLKFLKNGIKNV